MNAISLIVPTVPPIDADENGRTALMKAVIDGDKDAMLLYAPFEWGWADLDGYTALMHAVQVNSIEAVRLLINFEYSFTLPDTRTALMLAVEHRKYNLVPLMLERLGKLTDKHGYTALMHAVFLGDIEMVRVCIDSWSCICLEDLEAAKDVVDLGPHDSRDVILEMLQIAIAKLPDAAQLSRRVLCMGVIPKRAIPNYNNGVYPIDVHFHEENTTWRETEAHLCETIKSLHAKIEKLESNQLKATAKRVSRYVSTKQEYKSICLQTPFVWGSQSWTLGKLLTKIDSKQRKIAILEEEILTLQANNTINEAENSYFKEASNLRIKERTLKERVSILERAMDEHIRIINNILGTKCQSLMDVESSVKLTVQTNIKEKNTLEHIHTHLDICSPVTIVQEVSIEATGCDKGIDTENTEVNTMDVYTQTTAENESASEIISLQRQLDDKEAILNKICSVLHVEEDIVDKFSIISFLEELLRQQSNLQDELNSAKEKISEYHKISTMLHSLLTDVGVDSIEALITHISAIKQELSHYKLRLNEVTASSPISTTENNNRSIQSSEGNDNSYVNPAQIVALLRQLSVCTQRPCTNITDAMNLIHEFSIRATSERIALQKTRDDAEREHYRARDARTALANQEAAYNALINKHSLLINDAQLLTTKYNELGRRYNNLYIENEQLQEALASTRQQLAEKQSSKNVRFIDAPENDTDCQIHNRLDSKQAHLQMPITVADTAHEHVIYEMSADKNGHIRRSMSVDDANRLINRYLDKKKARSHSTSSGTPLYPAWNCCTPEDISKWLRRPLFI